VISRDPKSSQHWSEDFVEHVRTVHFSLIAVCLALIGVVQFEKPKDLTTAQTQLREIKSAVDNWDSDQVKGAIRDARAEAAGGFHRQSWNGPCMAVGSTCFKPSHDASVALPAMAGSRVMRQGAFADFLDKPSSLKGFCFYWDLLYQKPRLILPDQTSEAINTLVTIKPDGSISASKPDYRPQTRMSTIVNIGPTTASEQHAFSTLHLPNAPYAFSWDVDANHIAIPFPATEKQMDGQAALIRSHPYWKAGLCSQSFAELMKAAPNQDVSFESIASSFEQEAAKPKFDSFEVFGVKFPVETASRWGIILIVGIQLYLWIHLHELSPRLKVGDPGWDVAWMGVYRSLPARWLFFVLTVGLPIITIGLLGKHALQKATLLSWLVYIAAMVACLALSVLIVMAVPQHPSKKAAHHLEESGGG